MAEITGTNADDDGTNAAALIGTEGNDTISGLAGDDLLQGLGGDDFLSPGAGRDTVEAGTGDDRVFVWYQDGRGVSLDGGDGNDRLILAAPEAGERPKIFYYEQSALTGFEQIDLNGNSIRLAPDHFAGLSRITGFGRDSQLVVVGEGTYNLGTLAFGFDGTGTRQITSDWVDGYRSADPPTLMTWDATGADGAWFMDHHAFNGNRVHMIGGEGNDTLSAAQGDIVEGGAGDDRIISSGDYGYRAYRQPYSHISGGTGADTFVGASPDGRYSWDAYDHARTVFEDVEILEGGGRFTRAAVEAFDHYTSLFRLEITTPGILNLDGKIDSIATQYEWNGQAFYRLVVTFTGYGAVGDNHFTLTDHWVPISLGSGNGNDRLETGAGRDTIFGAAGDDTILSGDGQDTVLGGDGDDSIVSWDTGEDLADFIAGDAGNDTISTGAGNDFGRGGVGDDSIDGGDGFDTLDGGLGNDTLIGGTGDTDIADLLLGRGGNDLMRGGAGNDRLLGDSGNDTLDGEAGSDTLEGGAGDDVISGGSLADIIYDGDGFDFINGGFGYDRINLRENGGADRIFHAGSAGHGTDWILGFEDVDALVAPDGFAATDFLVQTAATPGSGRANVDELFVTYTPTGQIFWALVDGAELSQLTLRIEEVEYDLLV
jgi:Ca2+-binding RTX toxin-like protein